MPINAAFLAARVAEHQRRLETHLGVAAPLLLPRRAGGAYCVPQALLTERMRLELLLAGSPFVSASFLSPQSSPSPTSSDLHVFLWRCHPEFRRPLPARVPLLRRWGHAPGRIFACWYAYGSLRLARLQAWLGGVSQKCDLPAAVEAIRLRLAAAEQDAPSAPYAAGRSSPVSLIAPPWCYHDDLVDYISRTYHVPPQEVLDLPRALIHQLHRNRCLDQPDGELAVFAPSDRLLSQT